MALTPSIAVFRRQAYRRYWIMRQFVSASRQMTAVAIGWQVYDYARETRSIEEAALLLGAVGLTQFAPVLALSLIGGQAADRYDRKTILTLGNCAKLIVLLALGFAAGAETNTALIIIFACAAALGGINAFIPAASNSLYPKLVPRSELPLAISWNSLGFQTAAILGPALGGALYIGGPGLVYGVAAAMTVCAIISIAGAKTPAHEPIANARGSAMILDGLRYMRSNRIVLGAISLDLVVVLFGGATALLPVFARDILGVGAEGLGILRAAPALGAVLVAATLASRPLTNHVGRWLLGAIAVYGVATIGFGLSTAFWLSIVMLAITGAADMISVYIRQSLIQLATPDGMRGRVSSVSFIFISASNELGEFESGVAARFLGPVGAVLLGGCVALACAGLWPKLFPTLSNASRFEDTHLHQAPKAPLEASPIKSTSL